jgi:hypothetical protein
VVAWLCCGEIDFGLSICDFFFFVLFGLESWCFLWVLWWVDLGRMRFGRFRDLGILDCLGMSLLLLTAKIRIQKSHLRWLLQNPPPMSISQKKKNSLMVMMLVGLFGCRENQEMERNFWVFCFVLYLLTRCKI